MLESEVLLISSRAEREPRDDVDDRQIRLDDRDSVTRKRFRRARGGRKAALDHDGHIGSTDCLGQPRSGRAGTCQARNLVADVRPTDGSSGRNSSVERPMSFVAGAGLNR